MKRSAFSFDLIFICATALTAVCFCAGCSDRDVLQPDAGAAEYFAVDENNAVVVAEPALGREFLLLVDAMEQENAQGFGALKSKVVAFNKAGGVLVMTDVTGGKAVGDSVPSTLLVAQFPILDSPPGRYRIDFNGGLSNIFVGTALYSTDDSGFEYKPDNATVRTNFSIVDAACVGDGGELTVRVVAQVQVTEIPREGGEATVSSPTNSYTFRFIPYLRNEGFNPTLSPGQHRLGFFETTPLYQEHGNTVVHAVKFDKKKGPVVYALSPNTPAEYRAAIRDGVLSWNTVMGEEIVSVVDAPEGVYAPDPRYNVIQWVDNINAGSAYANFHGDPRTGELLHAEIYLTSVFAVGGCAQTWFYDRLFRERESNGGVSGSLTFTLDNFERQQLCDYDVLKGMAGLSELFAAAGADDEQCRRGAEDYLREVVAHEVGHTLGLRHNFAGNLAEDLKGRDRLDLFEEYLKTGSVAGDVVPSSSIMEYTDTVEALFTGALIRGGVRNAKYDELAMKYLYNGGAAEGLPVFCTDTDNKKFLDCLTFDYGRSPVEDLMENLSLHLGPDYIPLHTFRRFVYAKAASPGFFPTAMADVYLNSKAFAEDTMAYRKRLLTAFTADGLYVRSFKREMPGRVLKDVNKQDVRNATIPDLLTDVQDYLDDNRHAISKVSGLFFPIPGGLAETWKAGMAKILADPGFTSGTDPDGAAYAFSPAEMEDIKSVSSEYFENLQADLGEADVSAMEQGTIDVADGELGYGMLEALYNTTRFYLLDSKKGETVQAFVNGSGGPVEVRLPVYAHPWTLRLRATGLLKSSRVVEAERPWWGIKEAGRTFTELSTALDGIFQSAAGKSFADVKQDLLNPALNSDEAQRWYLENEYIKANFIAK